MINVAAESPIKKFPPNKRWRGMSMDAKKRWLIDSRQAADWSGACRLLAQHGGVVRRARKERNECRRDERLARS